MTLLEAVRDELMGLGYTGPIFFGSIPPGVDDCILLRSEGEHNSDPTRLRIYPMISVFVRGKDRSSVDQIARTIYDRFHLNSPTVLCGGYRLSRSYTRGLPRDLGRDGSNLWRRSVDLQITQPKVTQI